MLNQFPKGISNGISRGVVEDIPRKIIAENSKNIAIKYQTGLNRGKF